MNNTEKEQLAVKAFYYTKASEVGFKEANKLIELIVFGGDAPEQWFNPYICIGLLDDVFKHYRFTECVFRIKPSKVKTMVDIWVQASVEVEHEEGTDPVEGMGFADVYYGDDSGYKDDLGNEHSLYTTADMVLIEKDKLSALYNSVVEYSGMHYTSDSNSGDRYIVEDIKNQYNL